MEGQVDVSFVDERLNAEVSRLGLEVALVNSQGGARLDIRTA